MPKPTGPCSLCGAKTASSWRRIPRTVPQAAGQSTCNACYVYILKRTDDEDSVSAALEACRSAKRTRTAPLPSDSEEDEEDGMQDDGSEVGTPRGGIQSEPILPAFGIAPAAPGAASCSKPAVHGLSNSSMRAPAAASPVQLGQQAQQAQQAQPVLSSMQHQALPFLDLRANISCQPFTQQLGQPAGPLPATPQQPATQPPALGPGTDLLALQEACLQLSDNPQAANLAFNAACRLPGPHPAQLGVLPAVWLLLPGTDRVPQPAGALLLGVWLPPAILPADAQEVLLRTGTGLVPALRVLVYCRQTGQVMQWRDWVQCDEHALYTHPRFEVPTWDSSEAWKLLFPEPASDTAQARLFEATVGRFGAAKPVAAQPAFLVGSTGGRQQADGSSSCTTETASPHLSRFSPVRQLSLQQQQVLSPQQQQVQSQQQQQQVQSPPQSQQQQQQQQPQQPQLAMPHSLSIGQSGPQLPALRSGEWGQLAALLPPPPPQLITPAGNSFQRMVDSLAPQPQPLQPVEQQLPWQQQQQQQQQQPLQPVEQQLPWQQQQQQQQQPLQPVEQQLPWQQQQQQWGFDQQRGQPTIGASSRPDSLLPSDLLLPSMPANPGMAAGLLCGAPLDLMEDDVLDWIVSLGSSTAPGSLLPSLR